MASVSSDGHREDVLYWRQGEAEASGNNAVLGKDCYNGRTRGASLSIRSPSQPSDTFLTSTSHLL